MYTRHLPSPAVSLRYVCVCVCEMWIEYAGYLMTFPEFSSCLCILLWVCTRATRACYSISDPRNPTPAHAEKAWCRLLLQRHSVSNAVSSSKHVLTCQTIDPASVQTLYVLFFVFFTTQISNSSSWQFFTGIPILAANHFLTAGLVCLSIMILKKQLLKHKWLQTHMHPQYCLSEFI